MVDLSVVIPVYNEEDNLPHLWPELRSVLEPLGLTFEVVFVDDGSRDRSAELIRGFRDVDPRVRLVRLKANAGETAATDAGFKAARGRWVVTMDADLQNDPHDIPTLLSPPRPLGRRHRLARQPGRGRLPRAPRLLACGEPRAQPDQR